VSSATSWALVTAAAPPNYVASIGSIQNFGGYFGGALAPTVTGIIVQRTGSFVPALIVGACIGLCSALIYTFVVRRPISGADLEAALNG
jgi:cyanate permease